MWVCLILWCVYVVVVVVVGSGGYVCSGGSVCGWRCWVAMLSLCVVGDAGLHWSVAEIMG